MCCGDRKRQRPYLTPSFLIPRGSERAQVASAENPLSQSHRHDSSFFTHVPHSHPYTRQIIPDSVHRTINLAPIFNQQRTSILQYHAHNERIFRATDSCRVILGFDTDARPAAAKAAKQQKAKQASSSQCHQSRPQCETEAGQEGSQDIDASW